MTQETLQLKLWSRARTPVILQSETAECGLACLAMVAQHHGIPASIHKLRERFPATSRGLSLKQMVVIASDVGLDARAVRFELDGLRFIQLPCILHWNFTHFVVLVRVGRSRAVIHDPAAGRVSISLRELSDQFTGVALELRCSEDVQSPEEPQRASFRQLIGRPRRLRRSLAAIFISAVSLELIVLTGPFYLQWIMDKVFPSRDTDLLAILAIGFAMLTIFQNGMVAGRGWLIFRVGTVLGIKMREKVFRHLLNLPLSYFQSRQAADVLARIGAVDAIQRMLTTTTVEAVIDGAMALVILCLMFAYSPAMATISLIAVVLYVIGRVIFFGMHRAALQNQIVANAKQSAHLLETIQGIKAVKIYRSLDHRRLSWLSLLIKESNSQIAQQKLALLQRFLNGTLLGGAAVWSIWLGARDVLAGGFTAGALVAYTSYRVLFENRATALIEKYFDFKSLGVMVERLEDILLTNPERQSDSARMSFADIEGPYSVELRDVHFTYGAGLPEVINGLTFSISPGEHVAIVGPSGSGKSTLVNLLLGILVPQRGDILINGRSMGPQDLVSIRQSIGVVFQDDILLSGTIAQNVSFFDAAQDIARIQDAIRMACLEAEVSAMPMGLQTLLGEQGFSVSGGQKQRILLARALYRSPKILIFDEATSHLDVALEASVNQNIRSLSATRIVVAHRPETIKSADRVINV